MVTDDNQLITQASGTADWDTALNANFNVLERGYHFVERVGVAVNTGHVCRLESDGFMYPVSCDHNQPRQMGLALVSAASGDSVQFLAAGIVRSLEVFSLGNPGEHLFISNSTLGMVARSYSAARIAVGHRMTGRGFFFHPDLDFGLPEKLTRVTTISAVVASNHLFSIDVGKRGWNRRLLMQGSSSLVTLKFYSGSTRANSELLYETLSGGVTTVGSFLDQAGWPYENTEASTLSGLIFGTLSINSGSNVSTGDIGITAVVDRFK